MSKQEADWQQAESKADARGGLTLSCEMEAAESRGPLWLPMLTQPLRVCTAPSPHPLLVA